MALSKKHTRGITVSGQNFRWIFAERKGENEIIVQHETENGVKLVAAYKWDEFFPDRKGIVGSYKCVTPRFVADAIRQALQKGWDFRAKGPDWRLSVNPPKDGAPETLAF